MKFLLLMSFDDHGPRNNAPCIGDNITEIFPYDYLLFNFEEALGEEDFCERLRMALKNDETHLNGAYDFYEVDFENNKVIS